jgi:hypothetical protein
LKTGVAGPATNPQGKKEQYDMKHLKIAFGLAVLVSMMGISASSAMAKGPVWVSCLFRGVPNGQWEDSQCTKAKPKGAWETSEITKTVEVTSSSTGLELEDSNAGGAKTVVKCSETEVGTVGANGSDSTTEIHVNEPCTVVTAGNCKTLIEVRPVNLPWSTQLEESGGELRDAVTSLVAGKAPGWVVTCNTLLGEVKDTCEANTTTTVTANRSEGSVEEKFQRATSPAATCFLSKGKTGHVEGPVVTKLRMSNGELLAFWPLSTAEKT